MFKHNGIVYLDENEWEDNNIRAKYPDAMLAMTYEKEYGKGIYRRTHRFETFGKNRRERRK